MSFAYVICDDSGQLRIADRLNKLLLL